MRVECRNAHIKIFQKENSQFFFYERTPETFDEVLKNFKLVYEFDYIGAKSEDFVILETIFTTFNQGELPYKGRSFTYGDVVVIDNIPYFCARFGWDKIK